MKLSIKQKNSPWSAWGFHKGRYKNFIINVNEGGNASNRKREYYWVSINSEKYDKRFNSLWEDKKFETIEDGKNYATKWVDDFLKNKELSS